MISDLDDHLGPGIVNERTCFASCVLALNVQSWSLVWNAILSKTLPMFLSHLNEINGGSEKILPVSGSFWSHLKIFRMMNFTTRLLGWNVRVNGILSLFSFCDVCLGNYSEMYLQCIQVRQRYDCYRKINKVKSWYITNLFISIVFFRFSTRNWTALLGCSSLLRSGQTAWALRRSIKTLIISQLIESYHIV